MWQLSAYAPEEGHARMTWHERHGTHRCYSRLLLGEAPTRGEGWGEEEEEDITPYPNGLRKVTR